MALGLVVTVALAWTAMFVPHRNQAYGPLTINGLGLTRTSDGHRIFQLDQGRNAWHHVVQYWHMQVSGMSIMIPVEDYEARRFDLDALPRHLRPSSVDDLKMLAWYREVGLPFPALTCSIHWKTQVSNSNIIYTVKGGVQLPRDKDFTPRALPLTPVWPGFAADLIIWSAAVWFLMWLIAAMRTLVRRKRNCCQSCGYSLRGLMPGGRCPECGAWPKMSNQSN